jgi:hypothetical protein
MAKRKEQSTRAATGSTGDVMEKRVLAFAEQVGRIYGTMQAKAQGWLDRETLNAELRTIRDSATALLDQIGAKARAAGERGGATRPAASTPRRTAPAKKARARGKKPTKMGAASTSGATGTTKDSGRRRSGGAVDAPGKKRRGPMPSESGATGSPRGEGSRLAKLKAANMNRTQRRG